MAFKTPSEIAEGYLRQHRRGCCLCCWDLLVGIPKEIKEGVKALHSRRPESQN